MKKVAVLNDLSGFGKCSLGVAIPVLSVMGVQCCSIPTAILTSQTGYAHFYYQDLTDMIPLYTKAWKENGEVFNGIYSGYTTGPKQIDLFMDFVDVFYRDNTTLIVDPVMGDDGHTYKMFSDELRNKMTRLVAKADIITPNLTEACLLADMDIQNINDCGKPEELFDIADEAAKQILSGSDKEKEIIITGIKCRYTDKQEIYNGLWSNNEKYFYSTPFLDRSFSGTGDLLASIICGSKMNGVSSKEAIKKAADFVYRCIKDTEAENIPGREGVNFEKYLYTLGMRGENI